MYKYKIISIIVLISLLAKATISDNDTDISKLLDNFSATQEKLSSYIAKAESSTDTTIFLDKESHYHNDSIVEGRFDAKRACVRHTMWGDINPTMHLIKDQAYYSNSLWNGQNYYTYNRAGIRNEASYKGSLVIRKIKEGYSDKIRDNTLSGFPGSFAMGYLPQSTGRVDSIIREADSAQLRADMEKVGDSDCYVIEAKTSTGNYTIWIDPSHSYNIAKAEIKRGPGDMLANGYVLPENDSASVFLSNVRFEKVDDIWIPVEADFGSERYNLFTQREHYKITKFLLNPDHEALRSFMPDDIPDGSTVRISDAKSTDYIPIKYTWQDGKVVDGYGHEVDIETLKPPSLVGKALSSLAEFNVGEPAQNRMLLVCFWDMEQRPSRDGLQRLSKRAEELKRKGVDVVAVHASKVEKNKLDTWVKKNRIAFPVGIVQGDEMKTRRAWGIRALPWLILTDKEHVVRAEGFSLNELDEKITTLKER
jgi:hypothetical protein